MELLARPKLGLCPSLELSPKEVSTVPIHHLFKEELRDMKHILLYLEFKGKEENNKFNWARKRTSIYKIIRYSLRPLLILRLNNHLHLNLCLSLSLTTLTEINTKT